MHLPAGEGKTEERCKLWFKFFQIYEANDLEDDYIFAFGDQNWRTLNTLNIDSILEAIETKEYQTILNNDEVKIHLS
jgi:UDP-N-acetyl-D-mannosaminuronic acid transferase (WecB/TagA/CpsF family)